MLSLPLLKVVLNRRFLKGDTAINHDWPLEDLPSYRAEEVLGDLQVFGLHLTAAEDFFAHLAFIIRTLAARLVLEAHILLLPNVETTGQPMPLDILLELFVEFFGFTSVLGANLVSNLQFFEDLCPFL